LQLYLTAAKTGEVLLLQTELKQTNAPNPVDIFTTKLSAFVKVKNQQLTQAMQTVQEKDKLIQLLQQQMADVQ
jgi:hypothetical protein